MSTLARLILMVTASVLLGCQSTPLPVISAGGNDAGSWSLLHQKRGCGASPAQATRSTFLRSPTSLRPSSMPSFCGPTSAAIVLNAVRSRSVDLPRDHGRLKADDLRDARSGYDLIIPRYTQDNVIMAGAKTRAQILGEPLLIGGKSDARSGLSVAAVRPDAARQRLGNASGRRRRQGARRHHPWRLDSEPSQNRRLRGRQLSTRGGLGQRGGGHISPLGAYDNATDSFLVLDVNPGAAGWVWMPTIHAHQGHAYVRYGGEPRVRAGVCVLRPSDGIAGLQRALAVIGTGLNTRPQFW